MNPIAAASPTADLPMDLKTGIPIDLSLEDFQDEDLSDILHEDDLQVHSYSNDNFKVTRAAYRFYRRKSNKSKPTTHQNKEAQRLHRSSSVSSANVALRETAYRRPRPTSLKFFAEPARPQPSPVAHLPDKTEPRGPAGAKQATAMDEKVGPIENRLKPTYSDDTIANNNVLVENHSSLAPKDKDHQGTGRQKQAMTESTSASRNETPTVNSASLPRSATSKRASTDLNPPVRRSRYNGLTRSASEWSIEDPDKVEYCYINGEFKEQTHSALFKFVPRHEDEILLEINDPLHVLDQADDFWYEGINMRTGKRGIFPSYYAQSLLDIVDKLSEISVRDDSTELFNVYFLGSVEVPFHKGNDILCQAMHKVAQTRSMTIHKLPPAYVSLLVSSNGIKMMDQSLLRHRRDPENRTQFFSSSSAVKQHIHYFHLRNVAFCGHHPKNNKYFAFISRHPRSRDRFACHVFVSEVSTRPLAESIGKAFVAFYQEFMNSSHPTEDIYIE